MNIATSNHFSQTSFARGDIVPVRTEKERHFADFNILEGDIKNHQVGQGSFFYDKVVNALDLVNDRVITSDKLTEELIARPNEVNIHDVSIAIQKAQISVDLTKNVIQRAVSSYQSIINLR